MNLKEGDKLKRKKLIKLLIDNDLTQVEIANELEITNQHFSLLINGKSDPSFGLIEKFETFCNERGIVVEDVWELWKKE